MACPVGYVLVVEDDADIREALCEFVEGLGCNAAPAADGVEGLEVLERLGPTPPPCLVLLDLRMPRLDGDGFAAAVRSSETFESVPIVSMSAEPRRLHASLEADAHLSKPFDARDVIDCIACRCRTGHVTRPAAAVRSRVAMVRRAAVPRQARRERPSR